jgi:catalase-peroxidase
MLILGLTAREMVALAGGLRSPSQQKALGYSGSWNDADPSVFSNAFFKVHWVLLDKE